jgi:hypothetical protein
MKTNFLAAGGDLTCTARLVSGAAAGRVRPG